MYGPAVPLNGDQLRTLGERLGAALRKPTNVTEVRQVESGANKATHFVALCGGEPPVGLKLSGRIANGSEKERLVSEVSIALNVPNASRTVEVSIPEIPALSGRSANAIVWLHNATRLRDLTPQDITQIKADPRRYLTQYGQWMAVGLLLGVRDRHTENWVWASGEGQLAMIDNEECLQQAVTQDFYPGIDLIADRAMLKASGPTSQPGNLLANGLRAVQKRFRARKSTIERMLAARGFASAYKSGFMEQSPEELVENVFSTLA